MRKAVWSIWAVLVLFSCSNGDPVPFVTPDNGSGDGDNDVVVETDPAPDDVEGEGTPDDDAPVVESDPGVQDPDQPEGEIPDDGVIGKNCKVDGDCGAPLICVNAKCAEGCAGDGDCGAYPNTVCNKKLARCVNATASDGACDETNCPVGCCYAEKGFLGLKCAETASFSVCGLCPQGEIYMDGKQCVPAACKTADTKCSVYNSSSPRADCFKCMSEKDYLCVDDPQCNPGSTMLMINVMECVPAGERCQRRDICCSGMPCIQGYCY
ncbi:MAG TPA: hypothetical protein PKH10_11795 [bacterium]|nr:hypothetical protein [bacterium]